MKMSEWLLLMDEIAPLSSQEAWDNSGLQIDYGNQEVSRILVALEITGDVIEEAILKKANMIVVHHPVLFEPIRAIDCKQVEGDYMIRLIRNGISVYASHTCFDSARNGNNDYMMNLLGVQRFSRLNMPGRGFEESAMARVGTLPEPMFLSEFLKRLDHVLGNPGGIKVGGDASRLIQKVAVCTGGGGEYFAGAIAAKADVFISGDIKHHDAQKAKESGLCIIDAGHYGTEHIFIQNMSQQLHQKGAEELTIIASEIKQNPYDFII